MPAPDLDVAVIGSGPNGLAAANVLVDAGLSVSVFEAHDEIGGGTRTGPLTLPGFAHDFCSAVHPMGILSPVFRSLELEQHGLRWILPPASVAHPLEGRDAVLLYKSLERTAEGLGRDGKTWSRVMQPFLRAGQPLVESLLAPLRWPRTPIAMARFGAFSAFSANRLARLLFREEAARAVFAGCAGHSILPLERVLSGAFALLFAFTTHMEDWPVAAGGSHAITRALARRLEGIGGQIETRRPIDALADLPPSRFVLFDTSPDQVARIAGDALPARYRARLGRYRYGPAAFKVDWALDGPIPWADPRCLEASTVHVGGTLEEIALSEREMASGRTPERPYLILCQQSDFDETRAPAGQRTGYAYCHVPPGSTVDMTEAIEAQVERYAPGFRDRILARHSTSPSDFAAYNRNCVGGAITGGVADLFQIFTRPVARLDPYTTPNPRLFIGSASTPPGGGVHGQCGYWAARSILRRCGRGLVD